MKSRVQSIVFIVLLVPILGEKWCRYDCGSEFANSYGSLNYGTPSFYLPYHKTKGFSPQSSKTLCESNVDFSESNHPVNIFGMVHPTFAVLCKEGLKMYEVQNNEIQLLASEVVEIENGFITAGYRQVVLSANNKVTLFEVVDGAFLKKASIGDTRFVHSAGYATSKYLFGFFKNKAKALDLRSSVVISFSDLPNNSLFYSVVDSSDNIYYCNEQEVVKVKLSGEVQTLSTVELGFTCTSVLANRLNSIVISGSMGSDSSMLAEIDTSSFSSVSTIGIYPFQITGVSREAWKEGKDKKVAYLATLSNKGVYVIVETHHSASKGTIYSHFNTTTPLTGRPTLSNLANPVVFDSIDIISYTNDFLVKFFDTELNPKLNAYELYKFLPNPLAYTKHIIAFTTSGEAVLYVKCTRYTIGDSRPEDACPIAEIPTVETDTYWITILSGIAAGLSVPFIGETLCNKLKYLGNGEEDDVEVELYSEDEESYGEEEYLTPHPIRTSEL